MGEIDPKQQEYELIVPDWHNVEKLKREKLLNYLERGNINWELISKHPIKIRDPIRPAQVFGFILALILLAVLIVSVKQMLFSVMLAADHDQDVRLCQQGMAVLAQDHTIDCYANEDYWRLNLGHDISCTCFDGTIIKQYGFKIN